MSYCGPEQEYFLIDSHFFLARPDLINAGRTLFGAKPPKGQEFDDHYFGAIPERVLGFMMDTERELFKLGIPAKTRHNEVAPGQFEIAPMFERANVGLRPPAAADDDLQVGRQEARHGVPLPREAVRRRQRLGQARQLLARQHRARAACCVPGDTPHDNAQFLVFCARRHPRRRTSTAACCASRSPRRSNDHRLGANEAPPAIISIFLGDQLADVFDQIAKGGATRSKEKGTLTIGVDTLPDLTKDPGDRNRTSPFAFTGNRFEFRAPGSLQTVAGPMVVLNTIMAEALDYCATDARDGRRRRAPTSTRPSRRCSPTIITDHGAVIFNGNGYSDEWPIEAEQRGLKNLRTTVDALPELISPEAIELFSASTASSASARCTAATRSVSSSTCSPSASRPT